jgi:hypothetical protein
MDSNCGIFTGKLTLSFNHIITHRHEANLESLPQNWWKMTDEYLKDYFKKNPKIGSFSVHTLQTKIYDLSTHHPLLTYFE